MDKSEKQQLINAWIKSATEDLEVMDSLFRDEKFSYALFFCQLALEKLLKALFVKQNNTYPLITHDLIMLVSKLKIGLVSSQRDMLAEITTFNIEARYDIFKEKLYQKATYKFTNKYIENTKKLFTYFKKFL